MRLQIQDIAFAQSIYNLANSNRKKVLLVTCEFIHNGASLMLLNIAKYFLTRNYLVSALAYKDGEINHQLIKLGVETFVIENVALQKDKFYKLINTQDLIFFNTVAVYDSVFLTENICPYIWWCHEANLIYDLPNLKISRNGVPHFWDVLSKVPKVYTVSNYSKNVLSRYNQNVEVLLYGLEDKADFNKMAKNTSESKTLIFTIFGASQKRKGVDLIVNAVLNLPEEYFNKIQLDIVGKCNNKYAQNLIHLTKDSKNITWKGFVPENEKLNIIKNSDVIVCTSIDDPMPACATEAFMFSKPVLISLNCGQKEFIEDGKNGYIVPTDNIQKITDKIVEIIDNKDKLLSVGNHARKIYEANFTAEKFEKQMDTIINKILARKGSNNEKFYH